jgi:hypothetical protein
MDPPRLDESSMENVVETSRWNLLASGLKLAGFNDVYEYR